MNTFYLTHLYPDKMSIYGDMGNILTLKHKLKALGYSVIYQAVNQGDQLPKQSDFFFMGGGQDSDQFLIFNDLLGKKQKLLDEVELGVPLFAICGGYQLLGQEFTTGTGKLIEGIGLFPVVTKSLDASVKSRCIGNLVIECTIPALLGVKMVGFENHGGQTTITNLSVASPLGKTLVGFGNNFEDKIEGCVYKNAIGSYLHGSCLPKNPSFANYLVKKALEVKSFREEKKYEYDESKLNDTIAQKTNQTLIARFTQNEQ
jgi:lipid II isoglutaminyl synthase (glutamine-hydrolysing)